MHEAVPLHPPAGGRGVGRRRGGSDRRHGALGQQAGQAGETQQADPAVVGRTLRLRRRVVRAIRSVARAGDSRAGAVGPSAGGLGHSKAAGDGQRQDEGGDGQNAHGNSLFGFRLP